MKVYIVIKGWDYDDEEVHSVWADEGMALAETLRLMRERDGGYPRYEVRAFEVQS